MAGDPGRGRDVFVSYRRADTNFVVGHLVDRLERELGEGRLFRDLDSIPYGTDYRQHTTDSLARCSAALVVIGPNWVGASPQGRRIDDPTDLVRVEAEAVLARGIPVIPVLVEPAVDLPQLALPAGLDGLRYRQALPLRPDPDFETDVARIVRVLRQLIDPAPAPPAPPVSSPPPPPPAPASTPASASTPKPASTSKPASTQRAGRGKLLAALAVAVVVVGGVFAVTQLGDESDESDDTTETGSAETTEASGTVCDALQVVLARVSDDEVELVLTNVGQSDLDPLSSTGLSFVASDGSLLSIDALETGQRGGWFMPIALLSGANSTQFVVVTPAVGGRTIDRVAIRDVPLSGGFPVDCTYNL